MDMNFKNEHLLKKIFVGVLLLKLTQSQRASFQQNRNVEHLRDRTLHVILGLFPAERRSIVDSNRLARARVLYEALTKRLLRQNQDVGEEAAQIEGHGQADKLVENELKDALTKKTSALEDKPYVQQKGKNDFLVLKPGVNDPFVTVIPNDIYYNVEKKCVNWLDDCNARGIRDRLLQKVQSPYR